MTKGAKTRTRKDSAADKLPEWDLVDLYSSPEAPELEAMHREYLDKKVIFLGVAIKDTESAARGFVKKAGLTFPAGLDEEENIKESFGVYGLPTTFFISRDGLITYTHSGALTKELIEHELLKIL